MQPDPSTREWTQSAAVPTFTPTADRMPTERQTDLPKSDHPARLSAANAAASSRVPSMAAGQVAATVSIPFTIDGLVDKVKRLSINDEAIGAREPAARGRNWGIMGRCSGKVNPKFLPVPIDATGRLSKQRCTKTPKKCFSRLETRDIIEVPPGPWIEGSRRLIKSRVSRPGFQGS